MFDEIFMLYNVVEGGLDRSRVKKIINIKAGADCYERYTMWLSTRYFFNHFDVTKVSPESNSSVEESWLLRLRTSKTELLPFHHNRLNPWFMLVMMYVCHHVEVTCIERLLVFKFTQAWSGFHIYIVKCSEKVASSV